MKTMYFRFAAWTVALGLGSDFGSARPAMRAAEEAGSTSSLAPQRKRSLVVCASKR